MIVTPVAQAKTWSHALPPTPPCTHGTHPLIPTPQNHYRFSVQSRRISQLLAPRLSCTDPSSSITRHGRRSKALASGAAPAPLNPLPTPFPRQCSCMALEAATVRCTAFCRQLPCQVATHAVWRGGIPASSVVTVTIHLRSNSNHFRRWL